jgi:gliding-associated putative ABC transporter substrate-binding component GldG
LAQIGNILDSKTLQHALQLMIVITLVILANIISSRYFFRVDLTQDQRFSISDASKSMLNQLNDVIYIEVYLDGDLPAGFKRMRSAIEETLEEFKVYSHNRIQYQFVNPDAAVSEKSRNQFIGNIARKGVQPTDVFLTENGNRIQKRIIPGAVVTYGSRELGVQLFKGNSTASPEERINQSIEGIEYELAHAIYELTAVGQSTVGLVRGHRELDSLNFYSFRTALEHQFRVVEVDLGQADIQVDVLILAQPKTRFTPIEKYHLDQYIISGGKTLFMIDKLAVNMDSANVGTYSFPYDLDLDDQLFRYGVRINNDLVQDYVSGTYPVVVGNAGDQPQIQLLQWPFYPVVNTFSEHVIVRNIDALITRFTSSIDTVKADGIAKTVLFSTSPYARKTMAPVPVDINITRENLSPDRFTQSNIPLAYLLEGSFTSYFKNKFLPARANQNNFQEQGVPTKMIVIADGDMARNEIDPRTGAPLPLGRDPFSRDGFIFANEDLLINGINYLLAGDGIISARAKVIKIRPLDKVKVNAHRLWWQMINILLPILLLLAFGILLLILRKRKYTRF